MTAGKGGTLLSKLGFRDADRQDPMHDAACAYVASMASRIYQNLTKRRVVQATVSQEEIISKGEGQYKTTIGFADVVIRAEVWRHERYWEPPCEEVERSAERHGLVEDFGIWASSVASPSNLIVGVEVKWTEKSVSDAIRQIAVYSDFCRRPESWVWALATPHALNVEQKNALKSRKFSYISLNADNVRAFAAKQRATLAPAEMSL